MMLRNKKTNATRQLKIFFLEELLSTHREILYDFLRVISLPTVLGIMKSLLNVIVLIDVMKTELYELFQIGLVSSTSSSRKF